MSKTVTTYLIDGDSKGTQYVFISIERTLETTMIFNIINKIQDKFFAF